jgi:hypothetical protein
MGTPPRSDISAMDLKALAEMLVSIGCPANKSLEMAGQLDKRALQLAERKGRTYEDALTHLVGLMKQGWSAKERGV